MCKSRRLLQQSLVVSWAQQLVTPHNLTDCNGVIDKTCPRSSRLQRTMRGGQQSEGGSSIPAQRLAKKMDGRV